MGKAYLLVYHYVACTWHTTKYLRYNHKCISPSNVKSKTTISVKTCSFILSCFLFLRKDGRKYSQNFTWKTSKRQHFKGMFPYPSVFQVLFPFLVVKGQSLFPVFEQVCKILEFFFYSTGMQSRPYD